MAKATKETRAKQYREILAGIGIRFEDCRVLAFTFKQERRPELFHFGLMLYEPRPVYYLFECWGKYAKLLYPKTKKMRPLLLPLRQGMAANQ